MNTNSTQYTQSVVIPNHALGKALQRMVEKGKKPCFRIAGIKITLASQISSNPGYLYIRDSNWNYIGKVSPTGLIMVRNITYFSSEQNTILMHALEEPMDAAMYEGKETGTCCCCGRSLTNPESIRLGIGPICRGEWFPDTPDPIDTITDTPAMLKALDSVSSTASALGDPVTELITRYSYLTPIQQEEFFNSIKGILSDAGH